MREKFETSCKIWPSKKERRKCLAQEFCRYSGLGCVVVPETKVQDAEEENLNKAILGHVIDKAEQPRRRVTNSLATDMFDDADAYMAAGLLRRRGNRRHGPGAALRPQCAGQSPPHARPHRLPRRGRERRACVGPRPDPGPPPVVGDGDRARRRLRGLAGRAARHRQ